MSLHGQIALVAGASGSLGSACVEAFLEAGAQVVAVYRNRQAWQAQAGRWQDRPGLETMELDLLDRAALADAAGRLLQRHGRLDVLVDTAGDFRFRRLSEASDKDWRRLFDANARTVFLSCQAFWPLLAARGGRIINIGARSALAASAGTGIYAASKAAVLRLTEALAEEGRPLNIQANAILPSVIANASNQADPELSQRPMLAPAAVARLVLFLADPESAPISGAAIPIYGAM